MSFNVTFFVSDRLLAIYTSDIDSFNVTLLRFISDKDVKTDKNADKPLQT